MHPELCKNLNYLFKSDKSKFWFLLFGALTIPLFCMDTGAICHAVAVKVGRILPTSHTPRVNVFESYRPRKEECLDYKISQTFANFQKGDLKVNVKETHATYEPLPPEVCKKITRKVKRFHGGPPQWEFIDEIWLRQQEVVQKKALQELHQVTTEKNKIRGKRKIREHEIVQRLVGPEWFMELSPKQLRAIDQLHVAINKDLNIGTVINTQEIMATLGLVLRPNQCHLEIALKHSCRSAVEFLLVLYQILDPNRETYSLNDRLILSAIVHLAITVTLQELHIRIPSPPNKPKPKIEKNFKKEKTPRYKSPYLMPQTFHPQPPKFSGIYKNKHIQWPESPYFAYLPIMEMERKQFKSIITDVRKNLTSEEKETWKEYDAVQNFYDILPGAMDTPMLLPASKHKICWNLFNKKTQHQPTMHLVQVDETDAEECCNCLEKKEKKRADSLAKRSTCDKGATKFIEKNLPCDECLEKQLLKNSVKVMGGFINMTCPCDYVPVIQGTCLIKPCQCFIEYRNRVVVTRARQFLTDSGTKHVISGVTMSKFGPVYNFAATLGDTDCKCEEFQQIKKWKRTERSKLLKNNNTKFSISGIQITKNGPVYILTNVVARKACGCIEKYRNSLIVAETQHQIKQNPAKFVINGVINTKQFGPVYSFAGTFVHNIGASTSLKEFCGCLVEKPKCVKKCEDRAEYQEVFNKEKKRDSDCKREYPKIKGDDNGIQKNVTKTNETQSEDTYSEDESSSSYTSASSSEISDSPTDSSFYCKSCAKKGTHSKNKESLCEICQEREDNRDKYCGVIKSDASSASTVSNPCKCKCNEALGKLMDGKCQCDDCMVKIRRGYATHIFGGTKVTQSGNTLHLVQGIHQPQCSCMHDHLRKIKQVEEYKSRAILRYKTMRRIDKYCISGVVMTKGGPVYNISGVTPPVKCDCAIQIRQKQEEEERRRRMPKIPNSGRIKFGVVGVKKLSSKENVYILGNAIETEECDCMKMLKKFEEAHVTCVDEFDRFLEKIKEEKNTFDSLGFPDDDASANRRITDLGFLANDPEIFSEVVKQEPTDEEQDDTNSHDEKKLDSKSNSSESVKYCTCKKDYAISKEDSTNESSSEYYSDSESSESESEEFGPCTNLKSDKINSIVLKERIIPEYFMSKRYVIFKRITKNKEEQEMILKHILEGMAEDGFPLAKLPQAYKLPIFRLWWEMRSGMYWTQADRHKYVNRSIELWKHTDFCYKDPEIDTLPFTQSDVKRLTWANAEMIRAVVNQYTYNYYRKVKQVTIATGREFFAPTFDYQFPTSTWRDCAFSYIPTKEEAVFPYKIYQPHEARNIPKNKKFRCYS